MSSVDADQKYRLSQEQSTQQRAAILGVGYLDTTETSATVPLVDGILTNDEMYKNRIIPLRYDPGENNYVFGITTATPQSYVRSLDQTFAHDGGSVATLLISDSGFREFMKRYDPPKVVVYDDVKISTVGDSDTLESVSRTLETVRTDDILSYLISQAHILGSSDIHVENMQENVRIRFRIHGVLHPIAHISHDKFRVLQGSIASAANVSTANTEPQTGHIIHKMESGGDVNIRVETIPTVFGQDVVMRLFTFDESLLNVKMLGLDEKRQGQIQEIIDHPSGMVMVVGPTGSGKSTTLYSMLNGLNTTERKIITLEDPVEYSIHGISQIPINTDKGRTFDATLRSVLRLDPDIVMVGEIRDKDTAKTAIQASITGHLVLSTFHASSAAAAFARMIDMIGQNPIFANAIRMVVSQRLVRRLDDQTKQEYEPDETTKDWIRRSLAELPDGYDCPDLDAIKLYKPGSSETAPFGFVGRTIIMEQLIVDETVQGFIRGEVKDVNVAAIEEAARKAGMLTMLQDGVLRALRGETTIEEIHKVL